MPRASRRAMKRRPRGSDAPKLNETLVGDAPPRSWRRFAVDDGKPVVGRRVLSLEDTAIRANSFFILGQSESASYGFVVVRERRFVAAVNYMALGARAEAYLHGATRRKIFGRYYLDGKRQIGIPMTLLIGGLDRVGYIERRLHHCAINSSIDRENPEDFHVVALRRKDRIGEHRVDDGRIPHQIPFAFRHGFQAVEFSAPVHETEVRPKRSEIADVVN